MSIKGLLRTLLVGVAAVLVSRGFAGVRASSDAQRQQSQRRDAGALAGPVGPDIIVSRIGLSVFGTSDYWYWGQNEGIATFSGSTTACNVGDTAAEWFQSPDTRHPVITQNLYRYLDGHFEQVGIAWAKHGFCAANEPGCGTCEETDCDTLGVGCNDTYWGFLNGTLGQLGPRSEINPQGTSVSGTNVQPHALPAEPHLGRLAVAADDLAVAGARYLVEVQYVTHDEALDRRSNNVAWREVSTTLTVFTNIDSVRMEEPGLHAWAEFEPGVTIETLDVPNDGIFHVAYKVTDNGDGTWHYEYAVHNQTVNRAAASVNVPVPECVDVMNIGFHDVDYHSGDGEGLAGENYDGTDWPVQIGGSAVTWATTSFDVDPNANALRWATVYNFRFDADRPPTDATMTLGLYKPGGSGDPTEVTVTVEAPSAPAACPADCGQLPGCGDGVVDVVDLLALFGQWGVDGGCDNSGDGMVDVVDFLALLSAWGACE